jgi:predicted DNA-binding protein with PD1-like motif
MESRQIHESAGQRTFVLVLDSGDEVSDCLQRFADAEGLGAAQVTAIGAFRRAELAYFDWESKRYQPIPVEEQVEVLSINGDVTLEGRKRKLHLHAVLGRSDGSTRGGHLMKGEVRPTLEMIVTESPAHLCRRPDPESGLALIDPAR